MKNSKYLIGLLVMAVAVIGLAVGCSDADRNPASSNALVQQSGLSQPNVLSRANPRIQEVMAIQERHTARLMQNPEILGTATGLTASGEPAVLVLLLSERGRSAVPATLDGAPVVAMVTGKIVAMKGRPGGGGGGGDKVDHKAKQTPPIQLGTSGGWRYDLANGFCCGGTMGSLIQVGGSKRILSNYHVFEADIVNGGNGIVATTGDPIIQPGLIDVGCNANNAQNVATLVVTSSLPGSNVDCSSADIISGMVDESGAILEIGTLSSTTVGAFLNQAVKKSGRTSGLSRAAISGLNATVQIAYDNECAGGAAFTKIFTGQILTTNKGSKFLKGGDSGSCMVEDVTSNPRAVGLLYAGSRSIAVAQPIDEVLSFLGATMVGN